MKNILVLLLCISSHTTWAQSLPHALLKLFPEISDIKALDSCDINNDGVKDYLIAFGAETEKIEDPRTLYLFISSHKDKFQIAFQSDAAVYGAFEGPYAGHENLSSVQLKPNFIGINYYAGTTTRWSESHWFRFDRKSRIWYLSNTFHSVDNIYDDIEPELDSMVYGLKDSLLIDNMLNNIQGLY